MSISTHLQRKLRDTLGADAGDDLVDLLEDVQSMRGDLAEMRHEMQLLTARMDGLRSDMTALLQQAMREQTRFFFVAWSVLLAAIVGLYAK